MYVWYYIVADLYTSTDFVLVLRAAEWRYVGEDEDQLVRELLCNHALCVGTCIMGKKLVNGYLKLHAVRTKCCCCMTIKIIFIIMGIFFIQ